MVEARVAEALSVLLGETVQPDSDIGMRTCAAWDSTKHIEIVMTLEDLFAVSFTPEAIPALISQRRLTQSIRQLLGE